MTTDKELQQALLDVIRSKCDITPDGHWLWNGTMVDGRPEFKFQGKKHLTRRVIAESNGRNLNKNIVTYATCQHNNCVSPECVQAGTRKVMQKELNASGISCFERKPGVSNNKSKLFTDRQILDIIVDLRPYPEIAKAYNCARSTIWGIKNRKRHKNVAMPGDIFSLASTGLYTQVVKLTAEDWNRD